MLKQRLHINIWAQIITLPFIIIVIFLLLGEITSYDEKNDALDQATVKDIVEKYVIQCYAYEGSYPPDLDYLADNYGLILNRKRYIYDYDIFAANIMPEIHILDNNGYVGKQ